MDSDKMEKVITELAEVLKKHNIMYFINYNEDVIEITYAKIGDE